MESVWRVLFSRRMAVNLLNGFASGLPLLLTGSTLQAWLKDESVPLEQIGLFALVGLPYTLKFLWAPLFDRFVPPLFGRRRGWLLAIQLAVAAAIAALGLCEPKNAPMLAAALAVLVTFTSASQDIVLDAYRRESLSDRELGLGSSLFVNAYRLAMLVSGALALFLADGRLPWRLVYLLMAAFMGVGVLTTLWCQEPKVDGPPPRTLKESVVDPFVDFFRRDAAVLTLAFILLYKLGDQMAAAMTTPFFLELGFSKSELAAVAKTFGMLAMMGGSFLGGLLMVRLPIRKALWIFGVLQAVAILAFAGLAEAGKVFVLLGVAVASENFAAGMGSAAYIAFMASLTNKRFTATQYALFSSLMGVPRVLVAAPTGFLARELGWTGYFLFCTAATIPGLLLLARVAPWGKEPAAQGHNGPAVSQPDADAAVG
ncbi:MAG: AmpG family muropeptide MFS transporter [Deltaproteobacteria bacterium]|nr:AmpG family muropeptide MFS transporter [Deltaproteobacteria bacterium]